MKLDITLNIPAEIDLGELLEFISNLERLAGILEKDETVKFNRLPGKSVPAKMPWQAISINPADYVTDKPLKYG